MILNRRGLKLMALALMTGALPVGLSADEEPARSEPITPSYFPPPKQFLTVRSGCATRTPPTHSQSRHPATAKTTICHDPILRPRRRYDL